MNDDRTWAERAATDPSLRAFIDGEIGRAGVDIAAAKAEASHWERVARVLDAKVRELLPSSERSRQANRQRQIVHRRRHQFARPMIEGDQRARG